MKPGNSYQTALNFALLLVGEWKTGKTNVAMAFPSPWFLDCDRNISRAAKEVAKYNKTWFYDDPHLDANGIALPESAKWHRAKALIAAACQSKEVQTLVIDGLGILSEMMVSYLISQIGLIKETGKVGDTMRIQDWGKLANMMAGLVTDLRSQGKLVVITTHQKLEKDEVTGAVTYRVNVGGKTADSIGGWCSDVWATSSRPDGANTKYELHTRPTGRHISLGTSLNLSNTIDVTNKGPDEIWKLIGPQIMGKAV